MIQKRRLLLACHIHSLLYKSKFLKETKRQACRVQDWLSGRPAKSDLIHSLTTNRTYRIIGFDPVHGAVAVRRLGAIGATANGTTHQFDAAYSHHGVLAVIPGNPRSFSLEIGGEPGDDASAELVFLGAKWPCDP